MGVLVGLAQFLSSCFTQYFEKVCPSTWGAGVYLGKVSGCSPQVDLSETPGWEGFGDESSMGKSLNASGSGYFVPFFYTIEILPPLVIVRMQQLLNCPPVLTMLLNLSALDVLRSLSGDKLHESLVTGSCVLYESIVTKMGTFIFFP